MSRRQEQLLFRYSSALERGDFETVADVLRAAERDPSLEQMILDMNAAYTAEPSANHKHPKEVPMIAALYQKPARPRARVQWQSLPLVAALAVIALLVAMLAVQTRSNKDMNTGQGGSPVAAVVQNNSICQGTSRESVTLYSHPSNTSVIVGTLPAAVVVSVLDEQLATDGSKWILWFFVAANGVQGWALSDAIAGSSCPQVQQNFVPPAITPQQSVMTLVPSGMATPALSFSIAPATVISPTVPPPANANQSATACSTPLPGNPHHMALHSAPSLDATVVSDFYTMDAATSQINLLQASLVGDQIWYEVEIDAYVNQPRGWVSADQFTAVMGSCATLNVQAVSLATPEPIFTPVPPDQQGTVPNAVTTTCPASGAVPRITMYSRPSLDAYKFSQSYDAAQYAFFLLDSTDVDGQTWYYVRIDSSIDEKVGWITGDEYGTIKDCAPWNTTAQAVAVPSDSGVLMSTPTIIPSVADNAAQPTVPPANASPVPTDTLLILDTCRFDLPNAVALYAEPSNDARAIDFLHKGTTIEVSEPSPGWYWVTAHYSDGMASNTGFVRTDMLTLPDDCHLTPARNASVIPAPLVPASGVPIPVVPTIVPADAIPNISAAAIPVSPEISPSAPLCYFHTTDPVAIRGSMDLLAPILATLPAGIDLQLMNYSAEQNGLWLLVSTQVGDITISRAWIRGDDVNVSLQCPGVILSSPDALPTVTPVR